MKIGLALSGGGVRATVFHLGLLARLARSKMLEEVSHVSTVSGGSLAIGLVFSLNQNKWPASESFLADTLPKAKSILTRHSLEKAYMWRLIGNAWKLRRGRASVLADALRRIWGLSGQLQDLPDNPRWVINATTFETGKRWGFSKKWMGDYKADYVLAPTFPLADAVSASAGFPGVIGPLVVNCRDYQWHHLTFSRDDEEPTKVEAVESRFKRLFLWDGGVYENLGTEAIFKPKSGFRHKINFGIVSDASAFLNEERHRFKFSFFPWEIYTPPNRLISIASDQVRGLRARQFVAHLAQHPECGAYCKIGNTNAQILQDAAEFLEGVSANPPKLSITQENAALAGSAAAFPTRLCKLKKNEYDFLFQHGYEVADATLSCFCGSSFTPVPYSGHSSG